MRGQVYVRYDDRLLDHSRNARLPLPSDRSQREREKEKERKKEREKEREPGTPWK